MGLPPLAAVALAVAFLFVCCQPRLSDAARKYKLLFEILKYSPSKQIPTRIDGQQYKGSVHLFKFNFYLCVSEICVYKKLNKNKK